MWANLLSGTIGAVIGVLGATAASVLTVGLTRRHEAEQARLENTLSVTGNLAYRMVELYDGLREITRSEVQDDRLVDIRSLKEPAHELSRAITVDGPLLPGLYDALKDVRKTVKAVLLGLPAEVAVRDLRHLIDALRPVGDDLRELRQQGYRRAPRGMTLTG